jgi:3-deoxy-manno-octulosonate cytidylyltransferase (CMP-KDO synthetase)
MTPAVIRARTPYRMGEVVAVIPARLASTRLPRKVLLAETGKPLVQHVYQAVTACRAIDRVLVATDAEEVAQAVRAFGGQAVLTSPDCASGTDRVAQAAKGLARARLIVNVQGDEPEMTPEPLTALVEGMLGRPGAVMGTIATNWPAAVPLAEPGCVKVVVDQRGDALYFSRSPIPCYRDAPRDSGASLDAGGSLHHLKHVGLYAYRPRFLAELALLTPTPLEQAECLEQLRALEHGFKIAVFLARYDGREVNTPADYRAFVERERTRSAGSRPAPQGRPDARGPALR